MKMGPHVLWGLLAMLLAYLFWRFRSLIVLALIKFFGRLLFVRFHLERLTLGGDRSAGNYFNSEIVLEQFQVIAKTREASTVTVAFVKLTVVLNWKNLIVGGADPAIAVELTGFDVAYPHAIFKEFLDSPKSAKSREQFLLSLSLIFWRDLSLHTFVLYSLMRWLSSKMQIRFVDMKFAVQVNSANLNAVGGCASMTISFPVVKQISVQPRFEIVNGYISLSHPVDVDAVDSQDNTPYFELRGRTLIIEVEMHLPSGCMAVNTSFRGRCECKLFTKPLLQLYHDYQRAEDDSIELKIARGLESSGKMNFLVSVEDMSLEIRDPRSNVTLLAGLERVVVGMHTWRLSESGRERISLFPHDMDQQPDYFFRPKYPVPSTRKTLFSVNFEKLMAVSLHQLSICLVVTASSENEYPRLLRYEVSEASVRINKLVNNEQSFLDQERMIISVGAVTGHNPLERKALEWQFIAVELSNSLPITRFTHPKFSEMVVDVGLLSVELPVADGSTTSPPPPSSGGDFESHDHRQSKMIVDVGTLKVVKTFKPSENFSSYRFLFEKLTLEIVLTEEEYMKRRSVKFLEPHEIADEPDDFDGLDFSPVAELSSSSSDRRVSFSAPRKSDSGDFHEHPQVAPFSAAAPAVTASSALITSKIVVFGDVWSLSEIDLRCRMGADLVWESFQCESFQIISYHFTYSKDDGRVTNDPQACTNNDSEIRATMDKDIPDPHLTSSRIRRRQQLFQANNNICHGDESVFFKTEKPSVHWNEPNFFLVDLHQSTVNLTTQSLVTVLTTYTMMREIIDNAIAVMRQVKLQPFLSVRPSSIGRSGGTSSSSYEMNSSGKRGFLLEISSLNANWQLTEKTSTTPPLILNLDFQEFEYLSEESVRTEYAWKSCAASLSVCRDRSFLYLEEFRYSSKQMQFGERLKERASTNAGNGTYYVRSNIRLTKHGDTSRRRPSASFFSPPPSVRSQSDYTAGGSHASPSPGFSVKPTSCNGFSQEVTVEMHAMEIVLSPRMNIGVTVDALLRQRELFQKVMAVPLAPPSSPIPLATSTSDQTTEQAETAANQDSSETPCELELKLEEHRATTWKQSYVTHLCVHRLKIAVDCVHKNALVPEFAAILLEELDGSIEYDGDEQRMYHEIFLLDETLQQNDFDSKNVRDRVNKDTSKRETARNEPRDDKLRSVLHSKAIGGYASASVGLLSYGFQPMKGPLVRLSRIGLSGPIYSSGLISPDISLTRTTVPIFRPSFEWNDEACELHSELASATARKENSHRRLSTSAYIAAARDIARSIRQRNRGQIPGLSANDDLESGSLKTNENTDSGKVMCAELERSAAPSKIYMELSMTASSFDLLLDPQMAQCLDCYDTTIATCTLPDPNPCPPLVFWDTWRYWLHGSLTLGIEQFFLHHLLVDSLDNHEVLVQLSLSDAKLFMDLRNIDLSARNLILELDMINRDHFVNDSESSFYFASRDLSAHQAHETVLPASSFCSARHGWERLLAIPGVALSLHHTVYDGAPVSSPPPAKAISNIPSHEDLLIYNHHDVYLWPANRGGKDHGMWIFDDRFHYFRSQANSVRWSIEIRCMESLEGPVAVVGTLDAVHRLADAIMSPTKSGKSSEPADSLDPELAKEMESWTKKEKIEFDMMTMVAQLDFQIMLERFVLCTWPSNSEFDGFVFSQSFLDLQLRLLRENLVGSSAQGNEVSQFPIQDAKPFTTENPNEPQLDSLKKPLFLEDIMPPLLDEMDAPQDLQVDHMYAEVALMEVYARNWGVSRMSSSATRRPPSHRISAASLSAPPTGSMEMRPPTNMHELDTLFCDIYKLARATKVVISLTEDGDVAKKSETFHYVGALRPEPIRNLAVRSVQEAIRQRQWYFMVGKNRLGPALVNGATDLSLQSGSRWLTRRKFALWRQKMVTTMSNGCSSQFAWPRPVSRPSVLDGLLFNSFADLHQEYAPPLVSLPMSYGGRADLILRDEARKLKKRLKSVRLSFEPGSASPINGDEKDDNSRFSGEIFLRSQLLKRRSQSRRSYGSVMNSQSRRQSLMSDTMASTLPEQAPLPQPAASSFGAKIWGLRIVDIRFLWTIALRDTIYSYVCNYNELFSYNETEGWIVKNDWNSEADQSLGKGTLESGNNAGVAELQSPESAPKPPDVVAGKKARLQDFMLSRQSAFNSTALAGNNSPARVTSISSFLLRTPNRKLSLGSVRNHVRNSYRVEEGKRPRGESMASSEDSVEPTSLVQERRHRGVSMDFVEVTVAPRITPLQLPSTSLLNEPPLLKHHNNGSSRSPRPKDTHGKRYFFVELVDPQVNFLDTKSHSSLIIVAGLSSLQGRRQIDAIWAKRYPLVEAQTLEEQVGMVENDDNWLDSGHAQRQNELRLAMDGVSAFTVPTVDPGSSETKDVVHWKHLDFTAPASSSRSRTRDRRSTVYGLDRPEPLPTSPQLSPTLTSESKHLRMAIQDFQIRTAYVFFMDVTAKEAQHMHISICEDDLVKSFALDLPDICLDVDTRQFYTVVNVARNLLLAPPPQLVRLQAPATVLESVKAQEEKLSDMLHHEPRAISGALEAPMATLSTPQQGRNSIFTPTRQPAATQSPAPPTSLQSSFSPFAPPPPSLGSAQQQTLQRPTVPMELVEYERIQPAVVASRSRVINRDPKVLAKYESKLSNGPLRMSHRASREEMKVLIEHNLAALTSTSGGMTTFLKVQIGRGTWILRGGSEGDPTSKAQPSESSVLLEAGFTCINTTISYHEDRSADSFFEAQRLWARELGNPEKPTNISSADTASATVVTSERSAPSEGLEATDASTQERWVLMPVLGETETCARCGTKFKTEENLATACAVHEDEFGFPGEYIEMTCEVENEEYSEERSATRLDSSRGSVGVDDVDAASTPAHYRSSQRQLFHWSCCGQHLQGAEGCRRRPHSCKEKMISIRAEAFPTVRIESMEMTLLKALEVSIFPEANYDLHLRINRALLDKLHRYFSIQPTHKIHEADKEIRSVREKTRLPSPRVGRILGETFSSDSDSKGNYENEDDNDDDDDDDDDEYSSDEKDGASSEVSKKHKRLKKDKKKNKEIPSLRRFGSPLNLQRFASRVLGRADKDKTNEKDERKRISRPQKDDKESEGATDLSTQDRVISALMSTASADGMDSEQRSAASLPETSTAGIEPTQTKPLMRFGAKRWLSSFFSPPRARNAQNAAETKQLPVVKSPAIESRGIKAEAEKHALVATPPIRSRPTSNRFVSFEGNAEVSEVTPIKAGRLSTLSPPPPSHSRHVLGRKRSMTGTGIENGAHHIDEEEPGDVQRPHAKSLQKNNEVAETELIPYTYASRRRSLTVLNTSQASGTTSSGMQPNPPSAVGITSAPTATATTTATNQEGIYIRYLRIGDIFVDVTTAGFPLNLTKYRAKVEPYFCRGEVLDWHHLILKIERHAKWSLTKHTATTGLSRIANFLTLRRGPTIVPGDGKITMQASTTNEDSNAESTGKAAAKDAASIRSVLGAKYKASATTHATDAATTDSGKLKVTLLLGNRKR